MTSSVYQTLRNQLDQYSVGYPATRSGIEIKILKKLFSEKEAELFLKLSLLPETSEAIALRTERDPVQVESMLDGMYRKGLVFRYIKDKAAKYGAVPFVEGVYEYQVKSMDRELARMFEDFVQEALHKNLTKTNPLLIHRPIAINKTIDIAFSTPTYENSRKLLEHQKLIAVTDCICRVQKGLLDKGCDKPLETCFMFGSPARYFIEKGIGRQISKDEAFHILDQCEAAGLVTMPFNTKKPANLCNCCPDCCLILNNLNRFPCPAGMVRPSYQAIVDPTKCEACDVCLDRCPMDAILKGEVVVELINPDRCIGCGLCVSTCPAGALRLEAKPEHQRYEPPETGQEFYQDMARERGKTLVPLSMVK